jgi:hypothetical protein
MNMSGFSGSTAARANSGAAKALAAFASFRQHAADSMLLASFTATLFLSAFLLFSVQPMVSRMVLPRLGGSPAVWNTCVCFFQATLLLGYGYAHLVAERLRPRSQLILHGIVLASGLAVLPLSMGADAPPVNSSPIGWLLMRLTLSTATPFIAIAATAPLLQHWFCQTAHPRARDPYFLYAASNAGSLIALLSYPVLIERTLDLSGQALFWSVSFAAVAAAVLACGAAALRQTTTQPTPVIEIVTPPPPEERLRWVLLAFTPSALMLAVTTYITTDIAATPLFWIAPLAIYIVTYMLAFARRQFVGQRTLLTLQGAALAAASLIWLVNAPLWASLTIALSVFALTAAVCHTELAQRRPDAKHLTSYYLLIAAGGALGGVFCALLAPVLFLGPWEYPLLLIAACLLRPPPPVRRQENWESRGDLLAPAALTVLTLGLFWAAAIPGLPEPLQLAARIASITAPAAALLWFAQRRVRLAMAMGCFFLILAAVDISSSLIMKRSFFGILRVRQLPSEDLVQLAHGTTIHGVQSTRPGEELIPLGYYDRAGPFGRAFAALRQQGSPITAVNLIGLGVGALTCYARPGEVWTIREIDPLVERIARDDRWFHFITGCGNHPAVTLGDARLTLAADTEARYDVLIVDAFSSDSVPIHLLTREALALYFARLKPGGIVLFHVSNRYLNLTPVITRLAADANAPVRHLLIPPVGSSQRQSGAEAVAVAGPGGNLDALAADGWDAPQPGPVLWTDGRSDILGVIRWR